MKNKHWIRCLSLLCILLPVSQISLADEIFIPAADDSELTVERFSTKGKYLIVWLAPEYGFRETHRSMAKAFARQGIEVWQSNIATSVFLPQGTSSIKQLDGKYVADIIEYAHKTTGKKTLVCGDSYASISALRGAYQWQQRQHKSAYFIGAILFSPYTYSYVPPLGMPPEYLPIIDATNIPIMLYQSGDSGIVSQFNTLIEKLQQHGSPVYIKRMPDIMSLYYQVPPTKDMLNNSKSIPANVKKMIAVLEKHKVPGKVVPLRKNTKSKSGIDVYLKKFKGIATPPAIKLKDINEKNFTKTQYKGKVTLINFWATWCPPCIEEIPSLNRLKNKMKNKPFELITINYAEDKKTIREFMNKVNVEFPVLLDFNGETAKTWNVITYPSTFLIDKEGKIRYGVNAAIEWDNPEILTKIKSLM